MRIMWKFIMVMCFIALVGSRGSSAARLAIWMMDKEDVGRGFALRNKLQRGPVPPSQPSQCHHRLSPLSRSEVYYPQYVTCPWPLSLTTISHTFILSIFRLYPYKFDPTLSKSKESNIKYVLDINWSILCCRIIDLIIDD